ncbi:hypothetical protein HMPREF3192_01406 [Atopobium deltae]|uniref:Uncharacterized protein n=1 Tax=Atopobium deltae TaxID=1393034 RepID=A0A133XQ30_9ACTN|nr:hypothetical protein HMPREF3192_01406 [Atopobium deltae]
MSDDSGREQIKSTSSQADMPTSSHHVLRFHASHVSRVYAVAR